MIERLLHIVLRAGIRDTLADPSLLEDLFRKQWDLTSEEIADIRQFFEENPPSVNHGYPREGAQFPGLFVVLGSEREEELVLGDEGDDTEEGEDTFYAVFTGDYNILVCTSNADATLAYYHLAKLWMMRGLSFLKAHNGLSVEFSGADLQPDPSYFPAVLYARRLTLTIRNDHVSVVAAPHRAFTVRGIHVDDAGTGTVGSVVARVTTLEES